jgi:DNA-binding beta-propeller fold protein YncE
VGLNLPSIQMLTGSAPPTVAVSGDGNRIFVANNTSVGKGGSLQRRGAISVIQVTGTGLHPLRTTPAGANGAIPVALGLDPTTHRIYVSTLAYVATGTSTMGLTIMDGQTGAVIGAVPLPTKPVDAGP